MSETRKIILSFDDGPEPTGALKKILSVLQVNQIKAEFYVLGSEVERNPKDTKEIYNRGHKIQNHSWSHPNLATASEKTVFAELEKTQKIIEKVTNYKPTRVRPPYGAGGWPKKYDHELASVAKQLNLSIHNWDIDTEDWRQPRGIGIQKINKIEEQFNFGKNKNKTILNVLMHVQKETARDLHRFIDFLRKKEFQFAIPSR